MLKRSSFFYTNVLEITDKNGSNSIQNLADRQARTDVGLEDGKLDRTAKPAWQRLKSQLGRVVARRFERRCKFV